MPDNAEPPFPGEIDTQHLVVVLDLRIPKYFDAVRDQATEIRDALLEALHIEPPIDGQISVFINEAADDMTSMVTTQMSGG